MNKGDYITLLNEREDDKGPYLVDTVYPDGSVTYFLNAELETAEAAAGTFAKCSKCPYCDHVADGIHAEVEHMRTAHPDIVAKRLREAGLEAPDIFGELPKVTIHRGDHLIKEFRGASARDEASALMGTFNNPDQYTMSESDMRCQHCTTEFWHEALKGDEQTGWHCPACDSLIILKSERSKSVSDYLPASKEVQAALTNLANADMYFEDAEQKVDSAEIYLAAVLNLQAAVDRLEREASKFYRKAELELDE